MLRSAIGRVGLNIHPVSEDLKSRIDRVVYFLKSRWSDILSRIIRGQEKVRVEFADLKSKFKIFC